jgi:hypothetical protein
LYTAYRARSEPSLHDGVAIISYGQKAGIHGVYYRIAAAPSGQTQMIDVQTVDAVSTITLLEAIEALYPLMMSSFFDLT